MYANRHQNARFTKTPSEASDARRAARQQVQKEPPQNYPAPAASAGSCCGAPSRAIGTRLLRLSLRLGVSGGEALRCPTQNTARTLVPTAAVANVMIQR